MVFNDNEKSVAALVVYNVTLAGTYNVFGVMYVGLLDTFGAGEFCTSLVIVVYSVFSGFGC